jgi:hypothetical protein
MNERDQLSTPPLRPGFLHQLRAKPISPERPLAEVFQAALNCLGGSWRRYYAKLDAALQRNIIADFERHRLACLRCGIPIDPDFLIQRIADAGDRLNYKEA